VDLAAELARPWALALAVTATGADPGEAASLDRPARAVFLAAARSRDGEPEPAAEAAAAELAGRLPAAGGPLAVQSFVALSQTLPCFLAAAWLELSRHPEAAGMLRARRALIPGGIEELLRLASPARAVFRRALAAVTIGRATLAPGDRAVLMLTAANRDPAQFRDPGRLDIRRGTGHLAFGRGPHSCLGAPLIRMAAAPATEALLVATSSLELAGDPEWSGGFAIHGPGSLPMVLR
jgi:hypothetical protein